MPKLKTHRGAAKRFKVKGNGKVKFRHANRNHINTKKSAKATRQDRVQGLHLDDSNAKKVRIMVNKTRQASKARPVNQPEQDKE